MALIRIQEHSEEADVFHVKVSFNQRPAYDAIVRNPFSKKEEERLEWYFEEHLELPFTDQVRAQEAATSVTKYGETLFGQVFAAHPQILSDYKTATQIGSDTLHIEIVGQPSFHALHWEALKDPDLTQPLGLQATIVRSNAVPQGIPATVRPSPTINVLIVTARPRGKRDVGYRTISGPLVETLRQADVRVQIDILRPGTYKALENHLRETTDKHGVGYYHVIHFDVHGSLLTYEEFRVIGRIRRTQRRVRRIIQPYEGLRAFLALEGEQNGTADLVGAEELAALLVQHQIPIAILNACQSGKQVGDRETSLGSYLMQAGVQMVMAMGYSVTVSAAELLMRTLYRQFFSKEGLAVAMRHGRAALYNHKARRAYFNQTIDLEDWLLPVVYQNHEYILQVRAFTPEESAAFDRRAAASYAPPQPRYGFVGRDLDILRIEKRLLTKRNIIVVRGMGGAGKTTLLHYLGWWWQTTGFVEHSFYFGYDERAWTHQQLLVNMARQLLDEEQYRRDFQPLDLDAQRAYLVQRLRAENHLFILDNLESITGMPLAVQYTLSNAEQQSLREFLADLLGGRTMVLLGSRSDEGRLAGEPLGNNVYELEGLDPEAASLLVDRILEEHHATQHRQDPKLQELINLLRGFPLALEVVLPNLAHRGPIEVLTALQAGDINLDVSDSQRKTESLLRCIDYSYSNLSPEAQTFLLCLAPFTSVISMSALKTYVAHLRLQPALSALTFDQWETVLQPAQDWGLLSQPPNSIGFLRLHPILPYFLRNRLSTLKQTAMLAAIEDAFRELYSRIGRTLYDPLVSNEPQERLLGQFLTGLEYENLLTALNLALAAHEDISFPHIVLSEYLDAIPDPHRALQLDQSVFARLETYPTDKQDGRWQISLISLIGGIGNRQLALAQYEAAAASYRKALELESQLDQIGEKRSWRATAYYGLGNVSEAQQQWDQAEDYYQRALRIQIDLDDCYGQAGTYGRLGNVAQGRKQRTRAEEFYQQALRFYGDLNVRYEMGDIYLQLGVVAEEQLQLSQAEWYYQQALQIKIDFNVRDVQTIVYRHLGMVAQKRQQWALAEWYYQQALQIKINLGDRGDQAAIYGQLGKLAEEQHQLAQANLYHQQALQISIDSNARYGQAAAYIGLGNTSRAQRQWTQAEEYYQQALRIFRDLEELSGQAEIYHELGILAREQQRWTQAEKYYRLALQIAIDNNERYQQGRSYDELGVLAQEQQEWAEATDNFLRALERFAAYENTYARNIVLHTLALQWRNHGDADLPAAIATIINMNVDDVERLLREIVRDDSHEVIKPPGE